VVESVDDAITFLSEYSENENDADLKQYEIIIKYSNGDRIEAQFEAKENAVSFLEPYKNPNLTPVRFDGDEDKYVQGRLL
jgi:hypothetical protein